METLTGFFAAVPLDWFILGGIFILIVLDSLRSGIGRACAIAVALPVALLLYSLLDSAALLSSITVLSASPYAQALTFLVLVVLAYLMVRRMGLEYIDGGMGEPVQALLSGVAVTAVFAVVWLQLPILDSLWHFSGQVQAIFAEQFRLFWLLSAYAALAFARG